MTVENINKMIAADILPLGMSTEIAPKFDGVKATPHGFWAHDFLHYVYNLKFSFRSQIKQIYHYVTLPEYNTHSFSAPSFTHFSFSQPLISVSEVLQILFFLWQHEIAQHNNDAEARPEKIFDLSFGDIHHDVFYVDDDLPRNLLTFFNILKEKGVRRRKCLLRCRTGKSSRGEVGAILTFEYISVPL